MEVCVFVGEPASVHEMRDNEYIMGLMRRSMPVSHEMGSRHIGAKHALFLIGGHRSLRGAIEAAHQKETARPRPGFPTPPAVLRAPDPAFRMKGHPEYLVAIEVASSHPLGAGRALATAFRNLASGRYRQFRDQEKLALGDRFDSAAHWSRSMSGIGSAMSHASKRHTTIQIYGSNREPIGNAVARIPASGGIAHFRLGDLLQYVDAYL